VPPSHLVGDGVDSQISAISLIGTPLSSTRKSARAGVVSLLAKSDDEEPDMAFSARTSFLGQAIEGRPNRRSAEGALEIVFGVGAKRDSCRENRFPKCLDRQTDHGFPEAREAENLRNSLPQTGASRANPLMDFCSGIGVPVSFQTVVTQSAGRGTVKESE
jgi:hypothetical protein